MGRERYKHGRPSTSGTTASVAIIRKDRMFVANVGDSTAVKQRCLIMEKELRPFN